MVGPCHFYGTLASDIGVTSYKFGLPSVSPGAVSPKPDCSALREPPAANMEKLLNQQHRKASEKPQPESTVSLHGTFSDAERPRTTLTAGPNNTGIFLLDEDRLLPPQVTTGPGTKQKTRFAFETLDSSKY